MKKFIVLALLLITVTASFSQKNKPAPALTKQDYLLKSKHQKTFAWIMLGSGVSMVGGGLAINLSGGILNGKGYKGLWLSYLGGAVTLTSIPLFIASSKNKKRAASVSFKTETVPQIQKAGFSFYHIPSLTLKINL